MQPLDHLNDLRFIAAIYETGSLAGAARRLGVNHATVFRRITQSEERFGVRLFERAGGRYTATAAGEELARAGAAIELTAAESLRKVAGHDLRPSGVVRITTTDSVAQVLLYPMLRKCRQIYPDIQLEVVLSNQLYDLSKRDADIAIRPAPNPPEYLIGKLIGPLALAVYGARGYLEAAGTRPWSDHDWIALDDSLHKHKTLVWLSQWKATESISLRMNNFASVGHACVNELGLAILPCYMADREPTLTRVSTTLEDVGSELWLLTHPDLRDTTRNKAVFQLLHKELMVQSALVAGKGL